MLYEKSDAISWMLHSLKIVLGDESIREEILMHYHPELHRENIQTLRKINNGKHHIRTFDAFVYFEKNDASFDDAIERKYMMIRNYLSEIVKLNGTVVFTATNIQRDADDCETHFQSFIVDNDNKTVLAIDPAYNKSVVKKNKKNNVLEVHQGIYYAEVTHNVIKPFFKTSNGSFKTSNGSFKTTYDFHIVPLSHPAQISFDDVFCQSWSLLILDSLLKTRHPLASAGRLNTIVTQEFTIPETQNDKYDMLLTFYKRIFTDIPTLKKYLKNEYTGEIIDNFGEDSSLLKADPVKILLTMVPSDMM